MQPSPSFDWGRVVTPTRWVARVIGAILIGILGFLVLLLLTKSMGGGISLDSITGYITWGLMFAGILIAVFWKGIGELAGGLATIVGAALTFAFVSIPNWGSLAVLSPFLIAGLLFIACGWYTLAQRSRHATPTTA